MSADATDVPRNAITFRPSDVPADGQAAATGSSLSPLVAQDVIHRLFSAGLELNRALAQLRGRSGIGTSQAAQRLSTTIDGLDAIIVQIRDAVFAGDTRPDESR